MRILTYQEWLKVVRLEDSDKSREIFKFDVDYIIK